MNPEEQRPDAELRKAAEATRQRNRAQRRRAGQRGAGLWTPKAAPTPEHHHIIYHIPSADVAIPYYKEVFSTAKDAYLRIKELGDASEPQTEWYDDGRIGIETTLHGRAGLWWVILEVAACIRSSCRPYLNRQQLKRQFVVLPDEEPVSAAPTS